MKFFGSLDRFFYWVGQNGLMNSDAGLQCQLRAPIDNHTFTTSGDGLVSFIRLLGNRQIVGDEEFESACADFSGKLKSYLSIGNGRQHSFSFGCLTDASSAERFTANLIKPIYETGRRYGVESPALFRDIHQCLAANTQEDIVVLVVQTHVDGLTKDERADADSAASTAGEGAVQGSRKSERPHRHSRGRDARRRSRPHAIRLRQS
jgi:hypothetical protein